VRNNKEAKWIKWILSGNVEIAVIHFRHPFRRECALAAKRNALLKMFPVILLTAVDLDRLTQGSD